MKTLFIATLMCVAAMSAKAQVLTSETVKNAYEEVANQPKSDFVYNAEFTGNNITTMYVYTRKGGGREMLTLTPSLKYEYSYDVDGKLTNKVTYHWDDCMNCWACTSRHDYILDNGNYTVTYSRFNQQKNSFDEPIEKMIYSLIPFDNVNYVSYYQREDSSSQLQLISETQVTGLPQLFAQK